jgi:ParB family chromosome partitioning protein
MLSFGRLESVSRIYTPEEQTQLDALISTRDAATDALNAYYDNTDGEEDEELYERLEEAATAASDAVDNFAERLETFNPEEMKLAGAFITIDTDGELVIERGLVKREDAVKLRSNANTDASIGTASTVADEKKAKPLHGEKLCRRLTAHRRRAGRACPPSGRSIGRAHEPAHSHRVRGALSELVCRECREDQRAHIARYAGT